MRLIVPRPRCPQWGEMRKIKHTGKGPVTWTLRLGHCENKIRPQVDKTGRYQNLRPTFPSKPTCLRSLTRTIKRPPTEAALLHLWC
jgi:hypothetical protein